MYHADGTPIGNYIAGDGKTWSSISIKKGGQGSPEDDGSARDLVHRYAKQVVGAVSAAGYSETASLAKRGPFRIPNTFEARAALGPVQDRIREQRIAIIGLGGTGAFMLDLMTKTPVPEIHLLDADEVDWHTFMRAPGAPTEEITLMKFQVRRYKGPDKPQDGYEKVEADSAKQAAELVCEEPLTEDGPHWKLRATVHTDVLALT